MFFKIAGFELRYQLRQPIFWVGLILFVLLSFGSVASSNIQIGSTDNIHKNAAYVICQTTLIFAVLYMLLTSALYFALTTVTRSMMWTYVGLVVLMVCRTVFSLVLSKPGLETANKSPSAMQWIAISLPS